MGYKFMCLKYEKEFNDPTRKRKICELTKGDPKGCIWDIRIIKDTLTEDNNGIMIEKVSQCRYLKEL